MTGIKLETDTSMLPDSEQGFAPVVRGIANSDAQVVIKQNGYVIYQTWVSAGPFEIKDLSRNGRVRSGSHHQRNKWARTQFYSGQFNGSNFTARRRIKI